MNVCFKKSAYQNKRKGDGRTLKEAIFMQRCSTVEYIERTVEEIAKQYSNSYFLVDHDGIIRFTISCDDRIIYEGDHYQIESMLARGTSVFYDELILRLNA